MTLLATQSVALVTTGRRQPAGPYDRKRKFEVLLGKEFSQEKEVLLLQRICFYEGVLLWKKHFFDKEVLVWKKSSTKKRNFYFAKIILFQMRKFH